MPRPFHRPRQRSGYEVAAINKTTGESIFVAMVRGSKSRSMLRQVIFTAMQAGGNRLEKINQMTGCKDWTWAKTAREGIVSGDWSIRFSGRTALEVDQHGEGRSIYQEQAIEKQN